MAAKNLRLSLSGGSVEGYTSWTIAVSSSYSTLGTMEVDLPIKNLSTAFFGINPSFSSYIAATGAFFINGYSVVTFPTTPPAVYTGFREDAPSLQIPLSGTAFEIWSQKFADNVNANFSWTQMANAGTYPLDPNKWTLVYNFSGKYSSIYSKGGTMSITIT